MTGSGKSEVYLEGRARGPSPRASRRSSCCRKSRSQPGGRGACASASAFRRSCGTARSPRARRRAAWRAAASGDAPLVIGARSALFLPMPRLGLVVVDEEHDGSYKQEDGMIYSARDLAVARSRARGAACVLVSATPSLETWVNVKRGRYGLAELPERHAEAGGAAAGEAGGGCGGRGRRAWPWWICAASALFGRSRRVRGRRERERRGRGGVRRRVRPPLQGKAAGAAAASPLYLCRGGSPPICRPPLAEGLAGRLAAGEQSLLFLNRRGYAPLMLCAACGFRLCCPGLRCVASPSRARAACSVITARTIRPCPRSATGAGTKGAWVACGPGVERVAGEVRRRLSVGAGGRGFQRHDGGDGGPARAL